MDRTDVAAQVAKLAEYRKQQGHTKQTERATSASKEVDPPGQPFKEQAPLKPEFQKAHDHAIANGDKKEAQVSPQLREQDAARPTPGMNGPAPPQSTGPASDRQADIERLKQAHEDAKARQEQVDRDTMKDGKDHD